MSSIITVLPMIIMPLMMLWILAGSLISTYQEGSAIAAFFVLPFLVMTSWFSWRIYFVSTDGDRIYFRSYRGSKEASLSDIQSVRAFSKSRTPRIELTLKLGDGSISKISFLPPMGFTSEAFWDEYEFLSQYTEDADHDVPGTSNPRKNRNSKNSVVAIIWVLVVAVILGLAIFASK